MTSYVTDIKALAELDSVLLGVAKDKLVIIDCSATWCGPCKQIAPVYDRLSGQYKGIATFLKIDVDQSQDIAKKYSVSAMPTFLFIKNRTVIDTIKGANPSALQAALQKHTAGATAAGAGFPGKGNSLSGAPPPPNAPRQKPPVSYRMVASIMVVLLLFAYRRAADKAALAAAAAAL